MVKMICLKPIFKLQQSAFLPGAEGAGELLQHLLRIAHPANKQINLSGNEEGHRREDEDIAVVGEKFESGHEGRLGGLKIL
jgi:hypothetical protein